MSRRQARCAALQVLFQLDLNNILDKNDAANAVLNITRTLKEADSSFMHVIVDGTLDNKAFIDNEISSVSGDWHIDRMPAVDRNILRIAVYELKFGDKDLTPKIII